MAIDAIVRDGISLPLRPSPKDARKGMLAKSTELLQKTSSEESVLPDFVRIMRDYSRGVSTSDHEIR